MELPSGYRIRPASIADAEAVAAILLADDLLDTGASDYDEDVVRDQWSTPGFDPARDSWVVVASERVIGYATVLPERPELLKSWGVVHPEERGRGLGSSLLDRIEARAHQRLAGVPGAHLHHSINDGDRAARSIVTARGFAFVRSFRCRSPSTVFHDPGEPPPGIAIRGIDPERDLRAMHAVLSEAFVDEWAYDVPSFEAWHDREVRSPGVDLSLWLVATTTERIIGALTAWVWGDRGWIGELGVAPAWRGRGIATAMLRRSFATIAERGLPRAMLNVDFENPTGAMALYEKLGMRPVRGFDVYEKPLS